MKKHAWIFLILACLPFAMLPSTEIFFWKRTVMSMAVLFFVLAALDKKDLQPKIRILDVAFLFFTFLIFASHFWAEYPSLIWTKSFHWLLLAVSYLIARNIDAKQFDTTQCLRGFLTVNIIHYLFLVVVYFAIASSEGKMTLSYFGLHHLYFIHILRC